MARTSVRCVTIDCMNINYLEAGSGETVLLLHGIPAHSFLWRGVAAELGEKRRVAAPDLLGCGRSEKDEYRDISVEAQADVFVRFIATLGASTVTLVGHDFGACVAEHLAVRYPRLVSRLVLVNPPDGETWARMQLERYKPAELARRTTVEQLLGFLRESLPSQLGSKTRMSPEVLENYLVPWETPTGMGAFFQLARAIDHNAVESIRPRLESLSVPTLVIAGGDDDLSPLESCRRLQELIPGAALEVLEGVGHLAPEEAPHDVARAIDRFLAHHKEDRPTTVH